MIIEKFTINLYVKIKKFDNIKSIVFVYYFLESLFAKYRPSLYNLYYRLQYTHSNM